jgi:myo-inositol catabolism protein IolH
MRIALDPYMLRHVPLLELPGVVAELGYEWIELSPREDFIPFYAHPRVDDATVAAFKKALAAAGVGVSSVLPLFRWARPSACTSTWTSARARWTSTSCSGS